METPTFSKIYCCPHCGGEVDNRETVNSGRMWFCMRCTYCTSFETELKKIREEPMVMEVEMPVRRELTEEEKEEGKRVLAPILTMW